MNSLLSLKLLFSNALNNNDAVDSPISNAGWVMVGRAGFKITADGRLEKPITLTSSLLTVAKYLP